MAPKQQQSRVRNKDLTPLERLTGERFEQTRGRSRTSTAKPLTSKSITSESERPEDPELRVVVAWDFGTTYVCVAYIVFEVGSLKKIDQPRIDIVKFVVNNKRFQQSEAVCVFSPNGNLYTGQAAIEEAERISKATGSPTSLLRYLKLGICEAKTTNRLIQNSSDLGAKVLTRHLQSIGQQCNRHGAGLDSLDVSASYIHELWTQDVLEQIATQYKTKYPDIKERATFDMVLVKPTAWNFGDDIRLVSALEKAMVGGLVKIRSISLVQEPRAATLAILRGSNIPGLGLGGTMIVLDAGGGSVDLDSSVVESFSPLKVRSVLAQNSGGMYGATILTAYFKTEMEDLLRPLWDGQNPGDRPSWNVIWPIMEKAFETSIKKYIGCPDESQLNQRAKFLFVDGMNLASVPELEEMGYKPTKNGIELRHKAAMRLIRYCTDGIMKLAKIQIQQTKVKTGRGIAVFALIGGLADNFVVQTEVERGLISSIKPGRIFTPVVNDKSKVAVGAILHAQQRWALRTHRLRVNVGIKSSPPWTPTETQPDPPRHFEVLNDFKRYKCLANTIRWIHRKGESLGQKETTTINGKLMIRQTGNNSVSFDEPLYCAETDTNNEYHYEERTYVSLSDPSMKFYNFITLEGEIMNPERYPWFANRGLDRNGVAYWAVEYKITLQWDGMCLQWTVEIPNSGHLGQEDRNSLSAPPATIEGSYHAAALFGDEFVAA